MTRIGVLGGTFNPVHLGHLRAAEEVAEALELERVLLVPSAQPPHKSGGSGPLAPGAQRLAWVEAACAGNPRLAACDLEVARGGASYTVDTLRALAPGGAAERLVFIIGSDAFAELGSWREPKQLFALADFAVMARPGTPGRLCDWIPESLRDDFELTAGGDAARHRATGGSLRAVAIPALAISSSEIRDRVREGRSIRYLVPEAVRRDIEASRVYAS
jgi:nicotinate-nucleotide adenylyltransferase